jgi:membrane protease YdiL (CAAX protease family)
MSVIDLRSRGNVVGWAVAAVTFALLVLTGAEGDARWPWLAFNLAASAAYLLLLVPQCQGWARSLVARHPSLTVHVPLGLALYGMVAALLVGSHNWLNFLLWPVGAGLATVVLGVTPRAEPSPSRLLIAAVALSAVWGIWERGLTIAVPGGMHLSLGPLVAVVLAVFLLAVVHPLRTFDVSLGLTWRQLGLALGAVAVLAVVAIPTGFAIGFLSFQSRWLGVTHGVLRLFGLTLFVGLPEEMLFRGTIQEAFSRIWNPRIGLVLASVVFGLLHLLKHPTHPNWGYGLLATAAGLAYGWVYQRTGKLAAAAVTHGAVDWIWSMFLGA